MFSTIYSKHLISKLKKRSSKLLNFYGFHSINKTQKLIRHGTYSKQQASFHFMTEHLLLFVFVGKKSPIDDMKKKLACYLYLEIIKSIQSRFVKKKSKKTDHLDY